MLPNVKCDSVTREHLIVVVTGRFAIQIDSLDRIKTVEFRFDKIVNPLNPAGLKAGHEMLNNNPTKTWFTVTLLGGLAAGQPRENN